MSGYRSFELLENLLEEAHRVQGRKETAYESYSLPDVKDQEASAVALPPVITQGKSLQRALETRTATRFFATAGVELQDLGTVLQAAIQGDINIHREHDADSAVSYGSLQALIIAWRVDGLNCPHIYRYAAAEHTLLPICSAPAEAEAEILVLQRELAYAPVIVVFTGALAGTLQHSSSHGYRQLLIRGGTAGYNAWLAAMSLGYAGTVFAGILPRPLRELAGIDGFRETQLFAFTFGRPLQ